jgi:hypothetical protein
MSGSGLLLCKLTPETHFIGGKSLLSMSAFGGKADITRTSKNVRK